ncbi:MAG TPA: Flp pilus assembly protein CpaB [Stellaceae bacterium]|nr:Flp pilus assembly protein CpaB [Stellaceae bacterium]
MRAKTILALLFLLSLAVVAGLFYQGLPQPKTQTAQAPPPPPPPQYEVLATTSPLTPGTLLRSQDVTWRPAAKVETGQFVRPPAAALAAKPEADEEARAQVYGAALRVALSQGDAVSRSDIVKPADRDFLPLVLTSGKRAIAIPIATGGASAGLLSPGDHVDVLLTQSFRADNTPLTRRSVGETVVENLRVLAVDPATQSNRTVTLEVLPEQAEKINVATELGKLSLTLRAATVGSVAAGATDTIKPAWAVDVSPALRTATPTKEVADERPPIKVMRGDKSENLQPQ